MNQARVCWQCSDRRGKLEYASSLIALHRVFASRAYIRHAVSVSVCLGQAHEAGITGGIAIGHGYFCAFVLVLISIRDKLPRSLRNSPESSQNYEDEEAANKRRRRQRRRRRRWRRSCNRRLLTAVDSPCCLGCLLLASAQPQLYLPLPL